jgi:DNA-directed RNA polymerase specialized sigma24 family protein
VSDTSEGSSSLRPVSGRATEFAALFRESSRVLWLIAVGIVGDAALADDVVQEAAVVAYRKFDQFRSGTNFAAWMAQTVRYVALNEARREHRRAELDDETRSAGPVEETDGPATRRPAGTALTAGRGARARAESSWHQRRSRPMLVDGFEIALQSCWAFRGRP